MIIILLIPIILIGAFGLTIYFKVKNGKRLKEIEDVLTSFKEIERRLITEYDTVVTTEGKKQALYLYEKAQSVYFDIKNTPDKHSKEMADAYMSDLVNIYNRILK